MSYANQLLLRATVAVGRGLPTELKASGRLPPDTASLAELLALMERFFPEEAMDCPDCPDCPAER